MAPLLPAPSLFFSGHLSSESNNAALAVIMQQRDPRYETLRALSGYQHMNKQN